VTEFFEWQDAPPGDFAVIGDPVAHSLSPKMHAAAFAVLGLNLTYRALRVRTGQVAEALDHLGGLGYRGVNVTVPHKAEARAAMRDVDDFAARCDSVNTIRLPDRAGISTDGPGFLDTLRDDLAPGAPVLLLGAGGSARSIALALTIGGYNLTIWNRTHSRAADLIRGLGISAEIVEVPALNDFDLVVNATSASLAGESPCYLPKIQIPKSKIPVAYDLVYGETPFLAQAAAAGWRSMDGKPLLAAQGARSLEFWLPGIVAPREAMLEAIR